MRKLPELLAGSRRRGRLRVLSAWEVLQAQTEARAICAEDSELAFLACLLASALGRSGGGERILRRCSAEEIRMLAEEYYDLCRELSPAPGDEKALRRLEAELASSPYLRLYWRVLRAMGALPNERRAQTLTDGELLFCAANLALDQREAEADREENPAFDEARFQALKEGSL